MITFDALGEPQPKGSMRAFVIQGRARLTSDNPKLKAWQRTVSDAALPLRYFNELDVLTGPIDVALEFRMPRPKALAKSAALTHTKRPDIDKLARGVLDALTGVVWADDSQVAGLRCLKRYAALGEPSGVSVVVSPSVLGPPPVRAASVPLPTAWLTCGARLRPVAPSSAPPAPPTPTGRLRAGRLDGLPSAPPPAAGPARVEE